MAIPRRRVVLHQPVHDLLAEEELKELGFGDVRGQFDVIEVTLAKLIDHPRLVVLEYDEIHGSAPAGRTRLLQWRGRTQFAEHGFALLDAGGLQSIDEFEQLPLPAHELGAGPADSDDSQGSSIVGIRVARVGVRCSAAVPGGDRTGRCSHGAHRGCSGSWVCRTFAAVCRASRGGAVLFPGTLPGTAGADAGPRAVGSGAS